MDDYIDTENATREEENSNTKEEAPVNTEDEICSPPVQSVIPQSHSECSTEKNTIEHPVQPPPVVVPEVVSMPIEQTSDNFPPKADSPAKNPLPEEKIEVPEKVELKESAEEETTAVSNSSKTETKLIPFKFPPMSLSKSPHSESKPAVMTVAPLTKPSSSLPTSSNNTPATGTITHGLYTGISIKKSPPNTLPPFKISTHLLPPRVPPLKLSPPRFSKLEACLKEISSAKKSSASKKSKSSKGSSDKLELKVAQLKSASSFKYVAPLVISVPPEAKLDIRKDNCVPQIISSEKKTEELCVKAPSEYLPPPPKKSPPHVKETPPTPPPPPPPVPEPKNSSDEDKMDIDNDLFEGRLVIAEPDIPLKDDSDNSNSKSTDFPPSKETPPKLEDSEDEEIDVVDDIDVDSGRGSDISSRTEARSLCGDDDLGSPDSVPKTPEAERHIPVQIPSHSFPDPKPPAPKINGIAPPPAKNSPSLSNGNDCGVLDLSTCSRKRSHDGDGPVHRSKQVANPAVLDKTRQTTTPCVSPNHSPFKVLTTPEIPHISLYKSKHESSRGNFKCRGNTLTVINPDPNGNRPKIVIRNLGPRPDRGHERFHHHHHHHNHHHQRM